MKRIILLITSIMIVIILVGASYTSKDVTKPKKRAGCGYTIVEYGVGVDCNGDTIKLVRSKGFQVAI